LQRRCTYTQLLPILARQMQAPDADVEGEEQRCRQQ
jgi:hypothetical protein